MRQQTQAASRHSEWPWPRANKAMRTSGLVIQLVNSANTCMNKETDSSHKPWERMHPYRHLYFSLVRLISDSGSTELWNNILVFLKATRFMVICYSTRKITQPPIFTSPITHCMFYSVLTLLMYSRAFVAVLMVQGAPLQRLTGLSTANQVPSKFHLGLMGLLGETVCFSSWDDKPNRGHVNLEISQG